MTSPAREMILARLRAARPASRLPRTEAPAPAPTLARSHDECLTRFELEARALGVETWVEVSPSDVRARVTSLSAGLRVLSWDRNQLPYALGDVLSDPLDGDASREQQALADIGVTGCDGAIAETGSLAMISRPGRSRTISLLPPLHLAVVARADLCYTMAEFFETRRADIETAASCTFITGPSRTADIELTLTLGIHGPGRVVVVVGP